MTDKKYTRKPKDFRFLKAVDYIIAEYKQFFGVTKSEAFLSTLVFEKSSVIAQVRSHRRGVSQKQIEQFATHFKLDYNFFYRDGIPLKLGHIQDVYTAKSKERKPLVKISGSNSGNIYNSRIYVCLEKAKQIMQSTPENIRTDYQHILDTIHQELQKLEKRLGDQSQKIERLEKEHSRMIFELQTQLLEARKKETEVLEKYISLCENEQRGQYEVRENGLDK